LPDDEGEEDALSSELSIVKRKQRKRNRVKRVYSEFPSRSESEDELSDEEVDILNVDEKSQNDDSLLKEQASKPDTCVIRSKRSPNPRVAKRSAQKKQTTKQKQKIEITTSDNGNYNKQTKGKDVLLEVNSSNVITETCSSGSERDLAIDVEAFVNHVPVLEDVDRATSCPFCSVLCEDVIQHVKDCHHSECAVVDDSRGNDKEIDEEMSDSDLSSSDSPDDDTNSDEDYIPYEETKAETSNKRTAKSQRQRNKKMVDTDSESELCIDVENVIKTESGMTDIDGPSGESTGTAVTLSCLTCNLNFKTKDELSSHTAKCNKEGSNDDTPKFCCGCQGCGMRFHHWSELRKHFDENPDCRKLYQCDECDQVCITTSFLKKHKQLHSKEPPHKCKERSHKCSVCDGDFTDKRHSFKHTGVKEFKCDVCDKMFSNQRTLREHRRRHTGEKPFKCEYCEATFSHSTGLKIHTTKHTGLLQYKCRVCGKLFAKSYGLKVHSLSHSNDKPFVCEVCGKSFKRSDHFKQHKIIHSENKPFKCETCQRTFNQKVCLRKHLPCKEHEKQQKKLQNSLAKQAKKQNKAKRSTKSAGEQNSAASQREVISQENVKSVVGNDTTGVPDFRDVSSDVNLASSIDTSPRDGSLLASCDSLPSFVRPTSKLFDSEYYSAHSDSRVDYNALLNLPHTMFSGVEEPLSLDTLNPLSSHDTHALSGRSLSQVNSTDLASVLLSSAISPENLNSIVEETSSFFGHD